MANKTIQAVAIIDSATTRVVYFEEVTAAGNPPIPNFPGNKTRYTGKLTYDATSDFAVGTCIHYTLDAPSGMVTRVADDSDSVMTELALWNRKYQINEALLSKIAAVRKQKHPALYGQTAVYAMKAEQARAFRKAGYKNAHAFPMITDYASITGKTPQQAADQILRKAREASATLRHTEKARMVYSTAIFRATSIDELAQVADNIPNLVL